MNDEIAKVRIEIDGKDAQSTFEALTQESKEINAQLREMKKAGEDGSDAWQELRNRQREINSELKEFKHNIDVNDASINELNASLKYWQTQARKAKEDTEEWVEATARIQEIKPRLKELTDEMNGLGEVVEKQAEPSGGMWANLKTSIMGVFTGTALWDLAKEAGQIILDFGKEVFETTAKFEKYEAVLGNALGTHEKATKAMDDIKKMAAETPFSVDELTESYVKYVNRGLQPTMEEMVKMGDIAASQGKSFDQLTEAILDAGTGEFERLKEFGIQASKSGDEVVLAFKGMQQTVANTPEAITGALLAFGELQGVAGGMEVVSKTLEGRISNLGDNFDGLKLVIGEALMPVFTFLLDLFGVGITKIQQLFTWLGDLGENSTFLGAILEGLADIFSTVYQVISSIIDIGIQLFGTVMKVADSVIGLTGEGKLLEGVLALVGGALRIVGSVAIAALTGIQALADGMNIILNRGKEVANFFGASFKIDTSATWDNLKANAEKNLGAVQNLWKQTGETAVKTTTEANNKVKDNHEKTEKQLTETEKKEAEKRKKEAEKLAKDKEKATADLIKKTEDMGIKSIADETKRKIAQVNLDYKREQDSIKKSLADNATKQKALEAAEKKHTAELTKIEDDARKKKLKAEADTTKKIEDLQVKAIADETKRKIAQANLDYKRKQDEIRSTITDDALKQAALTELERKHTSDVTKIQDDARTRQLAEDKKKADEEKRLRDQKLNEEKIMLDTGFRNEVERARLDLALTRENSQAQWDAKRNLLEQEMAYKNAKLQQEAAAEKARIAESISDTDKRAAAIKDIDERLSSQLKQNETQLQNDKKKLQQEANEARKKNNDEFFKALDSAMKGDVMAFINYLKQKAVADGKHLNERTEAFAQYGQQIGQLMTTAVNALIKLNADYTKKQIDNLTTEKNANFKKLDDEYKKGKLTKEELDSEKTKLQEKFDADSLALKKKEFDRNKKLQIANALIAGSMAVLSAMAMPWPIGLAMAVVAAVKTAIDIGKIKNQKFEARSGGVFKNSGVAQGSAHGSKYGESGIVMYDRMTGAEVGEIEGGEPVMVLSRNTYANNKPVIDRLLHSSLHKNGAPISMKNGGTLMVSETAQASKRMFDMGGIVDNVRELSDGGNEPVQDNSNTYNTSQTDAMIQKNAKITEDTEKNTRVTAEFAEKILATLNNHTGILNAIKNKPDSSGSILNAIDRLRDAAAKANAK